MGYRIFDLHAHDGTFRGTVFDAKLIGAVCRRNGIGGLLLSSIDAIETADLQPGGLPAKTQVEASRATLAFCKKHPGYHAAFVCQPGKRLADEVRPELASGGYRALKFHPYHLGLDADDCAYDPFMDLAEEFRLPAVFHAAPGCSDPAKIYALARRHPGVRTVLYHINLTGDLDYGLDVLRAAQVRKDADLLCDTCWVPPEYVLKAIDLLGIERVFFGTDMPIDGEDHYKFYDPVIAAVEKRFGRDDTARWLWDQGREFLGIAD